MERGLKVHYTCSRNDPLVPIENRLSNTQLRCVKFTSNAYKMRVGAESGSVLDFETLCGIIAMETPNSIFGEYVYVRTELQ